MKVRAKNEEILTGVAIAEKDIPLSLQVNPSHAKNLINYRAALEAELSDIGDEAAYRPVPSQVSIVSTLTLDSPSIAPVFLFKYVNLG